MEVVEGDCDLGTNGEHRVTRAFRSWIPTTYLIDVVASPHRPGSETIDQGAPVDPGGLPPSATSPTS